MKYFLQFLFFFSFFILKCERLKRCEKENRMDEECKREIKDRNRMKTWLALQCVADKSFFSYDSLISYFIFVDYSQLWAKLLHIDDKIYSTEWWSQWILKYSLVDLVTRSHSFTLEYSIHRFNEWAKEFKIFNLLLNRNLAWRGSSSLLIFYFCQYPTRQMYFCKFFAP